MKRRFFLFLLCLVFSGPALAQSWPSKPLKLIVPFPPGGGTDLASRSVAAKLGEALGQPVVVENRPGAGGTIGADAVAKSAPDGYTIGTATSSTHPASVALQKNVPYDPVKSFAPITRIGSTSFVLLGTPGLPANNLQELIAYAKANPGKLNVANVGPSTLGFLMTLQFRALTGTQMQDIYYKGSSQVYPDLMSGQIQLFLDNPGASTPLVTSGKLKAFGVTTPTPSMPGVPLFSQAGLAGYDASFWYGLVAPAGTPKAIVERIQNEVAKYVQSPEGRKEFAARSLEPGGDTPEEFGRLIETEMKNFRALAEHFKIKPQ
ncbi:MAG TPA: tripartite tricarboxylate transporter substrate binding protein [Burkholderiales bacterium]|jgi:tripartite-type tricarboxylate transporter receptor subunit TctC|nr:tripartite tricarboxylate transporter substrate binding protein [Burkholderiales bacterium]